MFASGCRRAPDIHGQIRECRPEAEHHRLKPIATSGVCDVRSEMLFEDGLVPGIPCALDDVTHRSDVHVSAHASMLCSTELAPGHAGCRIEAMGALAA
jgi:hypothetical protein